MNILYESVVFCSNNYAVDLGGIADYFKTHSRLFYLYTFPPYDNSEPTKFQAYKNGKLEKQMSLSIYKGRNKLVAFLACYICFYYFLFRFNVKKAYIINFFVFLLPLNFIARIILGVKMVYWVPDYPYTSKNFMTYLYNATVRFYTRKLKYVIYLSEKLKEVYLVNNREQTVVNLAIPKVEDINRDVCDIHKLGFCGNLRDGQGLEILLDFVNENEEFTLDIIGDGVNMEKVKDYIKNHAIVDRVVLLGRMLEKDLYPVIKTWYIGIALYEPVEDNISFYAEPSKAKFYLKYGIPVVMTDITYFSGEIKKYGAGVIVEYSIEGLGRGIREISRNYEKYISGVKKVGKVYSVDAIYQKGFKFMEKK